MKYFRPRPLGILRVEDEADVPSPSGILPVKDLGRIGRWASFVRGLSNGEIRVIQDDSGEERVLYQYPELLSIDFRFIFDDSTPSFAHRESASEFGWSDKLNAKNTGILIGATLEGIFKANDLPLLVVMHTLTPADVGQDVATILQAGQILAGSGALLHGNTSHPFNEARSALYNLPKNCEKAVLARIKNFRDELLRRLGAVDSDAPPRLMIDHNELIHLFTEFEASETEEDLDRRLNEVGLVLWDREGTTHVLDLRSLFMDLLKQPVPGCMWGLLPLASVKYSGEGGKHQAGPVLEFVEQIRDTVGVDYAEAADHVVVNLDSNSGLLPFGHNDRPGKKLLALVFACAEEWAQLGIELARKLDEPWAADEDEAVTRSIGDLSTQPALRRILKALVAVLSEIRDLIKPSSIAPDGFYPIQGVGRAASILQAINTYIKVYDDEENIASQLLRDVLYEPLRSKEKSTEMRAQAVRRLMMYLERLGVVQCEDRENDLYYCLIRSRIPEGYPIVAAQLSRERIAHLLGFSLRNGVTNELRRIPELAGYRCGVEFVNALLRGKVPPHLGRAALWYLQRRSEALPRDYWPNWCV